jgi:CubicO group peptidase (beta-lactamase class C family)
MKEQQELMGKLLLEDAKIPALSVSWSQGGTTHSVASGRTDKSAQNLNIDTNTLFQASSLSKPLAAAIVLDLTQQLGIDLDTPLADIADYGPPELKQDPHYRKLTIRMVIGQCSGLPNWFERDAEKKFITIPGTKFNYSGEAFNFLKQVLEVKTNKTWETIAQAFFSKVGIKTATFGQWPADHPNGHLQVAKGHKTDGTLVTLELAAGDPAGSLLATAQDYIIFLKYCFADDYLKSILLTDAELLKPENFPPISSSVDAKIHWGLGMGIYSDSEKTVAFHWGNNTGFTTFCAMDMKTGDCITIYANSDNGPSVFPQIANPVVGDINPLFQWLAQYCKFRVESQAQKPETIAEMIHSMKQTPHVGSVHKTTPSWHSTQKSTLPQGDDQTSKSSEADKRFNPSPLKTVPKPQGSD